MPHNDKQKDTKESRLEMVQKLRSSVELGNADLFSRMRIAADMTYGDQWSALDRSARESKHKFCISIPLIKGHVKQVVGKQVQNPKELTVIANRTGTKTGAMILTKLAKHAQDAEHVKFQTTHWLEAGLANNVGFMGVFIDKNEDPRNGNLKIEKLNEFECGIDPNCNVYDFNSFQNGAKCFIWEPWVDKELIHAQYPDMSDDVKDSGNRLNAADPTGMIPWMMDRVRRRLRTLTNQVRTKQDTLEEFKYRVTHTWYRKAKQVVMLYDLEKGDLDGEIKIKDKDITAARKLEKDQPDKWEVFDIVRNIMQHHIRIGGEVLEEIEDELNGVDMYPIVAFSPSFENGNRGGLSEDLIGTQNVINFAASTEMDLFKKLPNTGWIIDQDIGGDYAAWLEEAGNEDGLVLDRAKAGGGIEKLKGTEIPASVQILKESSIRNMSLISGIQNENQVRKASQVSGKALQTRQAIETIGNSPTMSNLDYSKSILNNLIVEVIRANGIYSEDEIMEIIGADEMIDAAMMEEARGEVRAMLAQGGREVPEAPPTLNLEQLQGLEGDIAQNFIENYLADVESVKQALAAVDRLAAPIARELLTEQISNLRKGRYNTTVAERAWTPSMRTAEAESLRETQALLIQMGGPLIPARRLVLAGDLKDAEQIVQEMEQSQQQQQPQRAAAG